MDFTLDTKAAASYGKGSQFISASGKYIGELIRAADVVSKNKTKGLDLAIRTDTGDVIDYVTLWHTKEDGTQLSGFASINALMTCLRIRGAKSGPHEAEKWDKDAKEYRKVKIDGYPDLCKKRIGVVIQATIEPDENGADRNGKQIIGWFEASTELTASEILAKSAKPEQLAKQMEYLAKTPVKDLRKGKVSAPKPTSNASAGSFSDFDDDIPF